MKTYKRPRRVTFVFWDHMTEGKHWFSLDDVKEIPHALVEVTGWLLAEDDRAYLLSTARVVNQDKKAEVAYGDTWTILKRTVHERRDD